MDYMEALKKYRGIADNILAETQVEAPAETRRSNGLVQRIQAQAESDVENTIAGLTRRKEPKQGEEVTPEDSIAAFMAAGRYEQLARGEEGIDTRALGRGTGPVSRADMTDVEMRGGTYSSEVPTFINRLAARESSGDYSRVNTLGYFGLLQFGDARLADYNKANKSNITKQQFLSNPQIQDRVNAWHIADIDSAIDRLPKASNFSRDGLRAVAHLGGINGMKRFVNSGGEYNPEDAYGTSLRKYYNEFSIEAR